MHLAAALHTKQQKDTDLQVGVVSRSVRVRVCRAEGGSGEGQEHCTHTRHGQQGSAERRAPGNRDDRPPHVTTWACHIVKHQNNGTELCEFPLV